MNLNSCTRIQHGHTQSLSLSFASTRWDLFLLHFLSFPFCSVAERSASVLFAKETERMRASSVYMLKYLRQSFHNQWKGKAFHDIYVYSHPDHSIINLIEARIGWTSNGIFLSQKYEQLVCSFPRERVLFFHHSYSRISSSFSLFSLSLSIVSSTAAFSFV